MEKAKKEYFDNLQDRDNDVSDHLDYFQNQE